MEATVFKNNWNGKVSIFSCLHWCFNAKMGLKSVLKRKFVMAIDSNHALPIAKNKLNRNFISTILGEKWLSDIT